MWTDHPWIFLTIVSSGNSIAARQGLQNEDAFWLTFLLPINSSYFMNKCNCQWKSLQSVFWFIWSSDRISLGKMPVIWRQSSEYICFSSSGWVKQAAIRWCLCFPPSHFLNVWFQWYKLEGSFLRGMTFTAGRGKFSSMIQIWYFQISSFNGMVNISGSF